MNNSIADLIFPEVNKTVEDLEKMFPERDLPQGAYVTRFAPSPTGYMHIGGLYAALISQRLAKQTNGVFYLRIEDTDKKREVHGGVEEIINSLAQYDVVFQEGPFAGGESIYGPFKQSERKEIYQVCAKELMKRGYAYPCFATEEDLNRLRKRQEEEKVAIGYYGKYATDRELTFEEIEQKIKEGIPYVVRLKSPGNEENRILYKDAIRGRIELPENQMDLVLLKSDGIPTYHFAHVVDDHFMRTNLVVRGEEWLASYPTHKQLFDLCGFAQPKYVHISPIMKQEGAVKRKLSKRKDPEAAVGFYIEEGFPAESIKEYLLTIANSNYEEWRMAHTDKPSEEFLLSLKKMPVSGALFDMVKLTDVSKETISRFSIEECYCQIEAWSKRYEPDLYKYASEKKEQFIETIKLWKMSGKKVRKDVAKWGDLIQMFDYLYLPQEQFEQKVKYEQDEKLSREQICEAIKAYRKDLFLESDNWFSQMKELGKSLGYCPDMKEYKKNPEQYKGSIADLCTIVRIAITGHKNSPDLFTIMNILGEQTVQKRLAFFLDSNGENE